MWGDQANNHAGRKRGEVGEEGRRGVIVSSGREGVGGDVKEGRLGGGEVRGGKGKMVSRNGREGEQKAGS